MPQIIVSQEVQRVLKAISDPEWVAGPFGGTGEEQVLRVVTEAQGLWELTKPFCSSLQVAARWGGHPTGWRRGPTGSGPSSRPPARSRAASSRYWRFGICREWSRGWLLPRERGRPQVGQPQGAAGRQHHPGPVRVKTVRPAGGDGPLQAFDHTDWTTNTLARAGQSGKPFAEALEDLTQERVGKFHTPVAEWL